MTRGTPGVFGDEPPVGPPILGYATKPAEGWWRRRLLAHVGASMLAGVADVLYATSGWSGCTRQIDFTVLLDVALAPLWVPLALVGVPCLWLAGFSSSVGYYASGACTYLGSLAAIAVVRLAHRRGRATART